MLFINVTTGIKSHIQLGFAQWLNRDTSDEVAFYSASQFGLLSTPRAACPRETLKIQQKLNAQIPKCTRQPFLRRPLRPLHSY